MTVRLLLWLSLCLPSPATAQAVAPSPTGEYTGTLGAIHLVLRIDQGKDGNLTATLDSPDQGATAIPGQAVSRLPGRLAVAFATLHATYTAVESADGTTLTGIWTQGSSTPLVLHRREPFVPAASPSAVDGEWKGTLEIAGGPLTVLLHLKSDLHGAEYLSFDTPAQNAFGLVADHVTFADAKLAFDLPVVHGHYSGQLNADRSALSGTWTQGGTLPLVLDRVAAFVPAAKPTPADGTWTGTVRTPKGELRAVLHVKSDQAGAEYVTLDSPDQAATGLEATDARLRGNTFTFEVPQLHGQFAGTLNGNTLDGTWTQEAAMPVHLIHPAAITTAATPKAPPVPLDLSTLSAQLDAELRPLVENPALAGAHGLGVAVGVIQGGERRVSTFGIATPGSLFEIGSITKTFTGLLLARMVTDGTVTLDTPLRELLPPDTVARPATGAEITLRDLATHRSGLPRMPTNFHPADPLNPYADYRLADLYSYIATAGVGRPPSPPFVYSNVGAALLGQALAAKAGTSYGALLQTAVLAPLRMSHTFLAVPPGEQGSVPRGLTEDNRPTSAWDLDAFAPAGGLHATAGDMLIYLEAQLRPPDELRQPLTLQHQLQADAGENRIALSWLFDPASGDYWHNGGTGGFTSFAFFNPEKDLAAVVLVNRASALADSLGRRVSALLAGRVAPPLQR